MRRGIMKKLVMVVTALMMLGLAACSTATPTPESIVVTATPGAPAEAVPTVEPPPTAEPTPDDGNPAVFWPTSRLRTEPYGRAQTS